MEAAVTREYAGYGLEEGHYPIPLPQSMPERIVLQKSALSRQLKCCLTVDPHPTSRFGSPRALRRSLSFLTVTPLLPLFPEE
jgi:hypothetical protein